MTMRVTPPGHFLECSIHVDLDNTQYTECWSVALADPRGGNPPPAPNDRKPTIVYAKNAQFPQVLSRASFAIHF